MKTSILLAPLAAGLMLTSVGASAALIGGFEGTNTSEQGNWITTDWDGFSIAGYDSVNYTQGSSSLTLTNGGAAYGNMLSMALQPYGSTWFAPGSSIVISVDVLWVGDSAGKDIGSGAGHRSAIELTFDGSGQSGSWWGTGIAPTSGSIVEGAWSTLTWTITPDSFDRLSISQTAAAANQWGDLRLVAATNGAVTVNLDNLTFSASAVPEPSTYAALFGVVALGGAFLRRRRR